jgi:sugar phosphate isomerase/epimerase
MSRINRRQLMQAGIAGAAWLSAQALRTRTAASGDEAEEGAMRFGLVTYQWGRDWDLPTLLANCEKTGVPGVELRTTHAHGVEPNLNAEQRTEVRQRFEDSPVTCVGLGSNERFDDPDPAVVKKAVDATKEFLVLSHDIGATGVKVKPDRFHDGVPREQTIEQIGRALQELGRFAEGFGQQVRLEVHGQCSELPTIKAIMDVATHPSVAVCWNSNAEDLKGAGLEANFKLVRERFGETLHIHKLDDPAYPWEQLIRLLVETKYSGWALLEESREPEDRVAALAAQRELFEGLVERATQSARR